MATRFSHFHQERCAFLLRKLSLLLARQAGGRQGLYYAAVTFFLSSFLNDSLEQRDLRNYQNDLRQIFRIGRHMAVHVQSGIRFAIAQERLSWQQILGAIL